MSNDELNEKIYGNVLKEANTIFEHVMIPDGSYTASKLAKMADKGELFFNPIINKIDSIAVQIERFKCSFPKGMVFHILNKFEKLANIKKKHLFCKLSEEESPILVLNMTISSVHKSLINAIDDANVMPTLTRIFLDYKNSKLVASDGHILVARHVDISEELKTEDLNDEYIYLAKEMLKHTGVSQVKFYKKSENKRKVVLVTAKGDAYSCTYNACERYPNWERPIPLYTESGCFRFSEQTVKNIHRWITMCSKIKHSSSRYPYVCIPKNFYKGKHRISFFFQAGSSTVHVVYKENDVSQQLDVELEHSSSHTILITMNIAYLQFIPDWNGTIWIASNKRALLFDTECKDDSIVIMPTDDGENYDIKGKSFPYTERHLHLPTSIQPTEINNQETIKTPVQEQDYTMLMATKNNTEKKYCIDDLIEGNYEIREKQHDPDLLLAIRSMAHYTKGREELQIKLIEHFKECYGTPINNPDYFLNYPLPESDLAETFAEVFAAEGIDEIPDYPAADTSEQMQPELDAEPEHEVESEVEPEPDVELDEQQEEEPQLESSRSGLTGGKCIVPIMTLETDQGPMVISTYESFSKLDDSDDPCDHELIDRIDAFITSETFNSDPINYEAIASEVEEFLNLVEEQSHEQAI